MKKLFSPLIERLPAKARAVVPPAFWVTLHAAAVVVLIYALFLSGKTRFNTNLLDILPANAAAVAAAAADKALGEKTGRSAIILAQSADFDEAKAAAAALYDGLSAAGFQNINLFVDETTAKGFSDYLYTQRYHLLDRETVTLLEGGRAEDIADEALAEAFGAFTAGPLDNLEKDPFLLSSRELRQYLNSGLLSSGSMTMRDGVIAAAFEGKHYVMLRCSLSAVSVGKEQGGVALIYAAAENVKKNFSGVEFIFSGVPFHSYESSTSAEREISLISTITLSVVVLMLLLVFRSPLPILSSVLAIGASVLFSLAAALFFFREIHVLTFVFGTTLIGTCVDYSLHFFVHAKGDPSLKTGAQARAHILRSVTMSFVSSALCFAALLFAPFDILKQFAVFSMAGLLSSYLSVMCIFPLIKNQKKAETVRKDAPPQKKAPNAAAAVFKKCRKPLAFLVPAAALVLLFINRAEVRVENDIRALYTMSGKLLEHEKIATMVQNYGSAGWYFIVSGATPEETLQKEEELSARLEAEIAGGNLKSYMATTLFVPSARAQKRSYEAAKAMLPLLGRQYEYLGLPAETEALYREDFERAALDYAVPGKALPALVQDLVSQLWLDNIDGRYYSCVLPLHAKDEAAFRSIAAETENVFFINKVKDIGGALDSLTRMMLVLFVIAYIVIAVVVKLFYSWKQALRICAVPLLLLVETLAVLACAGIPLGFFSVSAFVLIFGLGLDYMFYTADGGGGSPLTIKAIVLSFATTALSFGSLALSSFVPVHIFGLTVFAGITAAFVSAMLIHAPHDRRNLP